MKTSDNERIKYEITGQAVLQILRMKINFSLQTLIKQLLVMKSAEEDAFRRDLIDSIIRDFSNSDSGGGQTEEQRQLTIKVCSMVRK
ncbi:protein involved in biofilm formation [Escherichia coli]|nr:protein involved in biofilm formation [Escherichia coli]